jgi:hypothetical protein
MQPDNLAFAEDVKLIVIAGTAVDLVNVSDVRISFFQSIEDAPIELVVRMVRTSPRMTNSARIL